MPHFTQNISSVAVEFDTTFTTLITQSQIHVHVVAVKTRLLHTSFSALTRIVQVPKMYRMSVTRIISWMKDNETSPLIIEMVGEYLKAQNTKSMSELYKGPPTNNTNGRGWQLAQEHDLLDWQNFMEGRISSKYVEMQRSYYMSKVQQSGRKKRTRWSKPEKKIYRKVRSNGLPAL